MSSIKRSASALKLLTARQVLAAEDGDPSDGGGLTLRVRGDSASRRQPCCRPCRPSKPRSRVDNMAGELAPLLVALGDLSVLNRARLAESSR